MSELLIGTRFGRWVINGVREKRGNYFVIPAICDCGTERLVNVCNLKRGLTPSCGCISQERRFKHGGCKTSEYRAWQHMRERCEDPLNPRYACYGGRGISVCSQWKNSFETFHGNYEPGNCRWATYSEQAVNTTKNRRLTFNGKTLCVAEWARETGINKSTLAKRVGAYKWNVERALSEAAK